MNLSLRQLQNEQDDWRRRNFPNSGWDRAFLGVVEEVGELAHHLLKGDQGIRGSLDEHEERAQDAVGDILVYIAHLCNGKAWDMQACLDKAWAHVKSRDWIADPDGGVTATPAIQSE